MLGELRRGECSETTTARLRAAQGEGWVEDGIKPTRLHTHKHSLERVNAAVVSPAWREGRRAIKR